MTARRAVELVLGVLAGLNCGLALDYSGLALAWSMLCVGWQLRPTRQSPTLQLTHLRQELAISLGLGQTLNE